MVYELTWFYISCQNKILHLSQRGCDRFSAAVGDRGEMMSLALLMTFSTCDPFNKSVHIIHPSCVYANLGNKLALRTCELHESVCVCILAFLNGRNMISWNRMWRIFPTFKLVFHDLTSAHQQKNKTVMKTSLFTMNHLWAVIKVDLCLIGGDRTKAGSWKHTFLLPVWLYRVKKSICCSWKQSLHFWDHENPDVSLWVWPWSWEPAYASH